jgi:uncharacterized damage-inducible protein DinB
MAQVDDHGRPEPPVDADELDTLLGFLDFQRSTLEWKCRGLGSEGLRTRIAASDMTLAGLLKHMAYVEEYWFSQRLHGRDQGPPWNNVDWDADRDWEWHTAPDDDPPHLWDLWRTAVGKSRDDVALALTHGGLDQPAAQPWANGESPNLRWILCHMIEEYARHNGHADLIREAVDGETGE